MITGRQPGADITLVNTLFWRAPKTEDGKINDYLTIVYKDNANGQKFAEEIINPDYRYYIVDKEHRTTYPRLFIEDEYVHPVVVPYRNLEKDIAKRVGLDKYFYDNISSGNPSENKKIHQHPDIFNSDMNIEDHYMLRFSQLYKNDPTPITKAFFDIETDTINMMGDFPEPGECPINAISLVLQDQQQIFSFLLRNPANPQIQQFEEEVKSGSIYKELNDFIINAVGGPKVAANYNINFKYNFLFYDQNNEISLIKDLFNAINAFKPDFALAWNMGFDIPYIIARINKLGYDPRDIMCSPDFTNKVADYYVDERNKSDFAERGDFARISSYTVFLDQMIHFASRRKGQNKFHSFTLDFIGEHVAKVKKLDYKHITTSIAELPYKSYKTFVFYNIMDTIVQYCIEHVTGDLNYVFTKSNANCTRYCKTHRQTVYLTNRVTKDIAKKHFIIGNNCNKFNPKPDTKFPGAFVANPEQLSDYSKIKIAGKAILCFNNLDDFDYKSLYPSLIREFNIAPNTQIGMLIILGIEFTHEQLVRANNTVAGAFMEDMQSQVWLEVGTRWFNLADFTTLCSDIRYFFDNIMSPSNAYTKYDSNGYIIPVIFVNKCKYENPMIFFDNNPMNDVYMKPNYNRWEEFRQYAIAHPNQQF